MLQAVVFDFDGVIVNSEPLHLRAYQEVLRDEGLSLGAREYAERYLGFDDEAVFTGLAEARNLTVEPGWVAEMIARKTGRMQRLLAEDSVLFRGAAECVRECAAAVPVGLASGALRHEILHVLESTGLRDVFTVIVAAGETPRGKPAPDPYLEAIRQLEEASGKVIEPRRTAAVEDSVQGLAAARSAGLRCVAVTTTYDAAAFEGADLIVSDISALNLRRIAGLWRDGA